MNQNGGSGNNIAIYLMIEFLNKGFKGEYSQNFCELHNLLCGWSNSYFCIVCFIFFNHLFSISDLVGNAAGQITDAVLDRASEMLGIKETLMKLYDNEVWKL